MTKKLVCMFLAALLLAAPLTACKKEPDAEPDTSLTLYLGSRDMDAFLSGLRLRFPDIQFEITQYCGADSSAFLRECAMHGDLGDLVFYPESLPGELAGQTLLDLSDQPLVERIDPDVLRQLNAYGPVYQIPGPAAVRSMAYNKTLFDEYGWTVPQSSEELIETVRQIRHDAPGLIPIAMSLGGVGYPFACVTTFSQAGFLSSAEGAGWEARYLRGEASIGEGWAEGMEITAGLIDAGAFKGDEQFVGRWDGDVIDTCFSQGQAAMMFVWGGQPGLVRAMADSEYELQLLPFCGTERGRAFVGVTPSSVWGVSKRLGEPGNEEKLENALRVMEWIATPEAQVLLASSPSEIPTLKNADEGVPAVYRALWTLAAGADKAPMIYAGYEDILIEAGTLIQSYILAGNAAGMKEELTGLVDRTHANALAQSAAAVRYGEFAADLSAAQSVQLIADVIDAAGLADFALVSRGGKQDGAANLYGVSGWVYAGAVDQSNYDILMAGLGSRHVDILTLTGTQVRALIENGKPAELEDESRDGAAPPEVSWPYYWSGLEVTMEEDGTASAELDGTPLEDTTIYRVAFVNGDYTAVIAAAGAPEDTGVAVIDLFTDYLGKNSPVPAPEVLRP